MKRLARRCWVIFQFLIIAMFMASCLSPGQRRQIEEDSQRLQEMDTKVGVLQANLQENQAARNALQQLVDSLNQQLRDLNERSSQDQAKIKELAASKTHLEDLLTQLQLVRLDGLAQIPSPTSPPALASPSPSAIPIATNSPDPVDTKTASPTPDIRRINPVASPTTLPESNSIPAEGSDLLVQGGVLQDRKDRLAMRGTPLFSERDSQSGALLYYHRDFWYDRPGMFIEIYGSRENGYHANLIVQSVIKQRDPSMSFGKLTFIKSATNPDSVALTSDFGYPRLRNYLRAESQVMESLVYDLDTLSITRLLEALDDPAPQWQVVREAGPAPTPNSLSAAARKALLEMLQAVADLTNGVLH